MIEEEKVRLVLEVVKHYRTDEDPMDLYVRLEATERLLKKLLVLDGEVDGS